MTFAIAASIAISAAANIASRALAEKPKAAPTPAAVPTPYEVNAARTISIRQSVPPRQFVYGECRIGGYVFFEDNDNPHLFVGCALSDGESNAITGVYFGNINIPLAAESPAGQAAALGGYPYYGNFDLSYRLGTPTQTADPLLSGAFTLPTDFWQRGVTCCVVRLNWGANGDKHSVLWGNSIEPSFSGQFRKVYDPRDGTQTLGTRSTYKYSDNPALCVADALTSAWGIGLSTDYIDWTSVGTAADVCDTTLTYNGNTVKYFTLSGVFRSETDMASQISDMLASFRGVLTYSDGKYKIVADEARSSVWTITDDDILELIEHVHGASRRDAYSAIKATYFDTADASREAATEVYEDAAAVLAEGVRETTIRLPFCPAVHSAQILAYRKLAEIRNGRRLTIRVSDAGLFLDAFEVVTVTSASASFINGTWQIDQIDVADVGVILTLREYVSALYNSPAGYLI